MVETSAGVGSIWNKNSWHWEEKNYTEWGKKRLGEMVVPAIIPASSDSILIQLYEVKELKGTCNITIRKQKQLFLYEFELDIYFEASRGDEECKGRVQVHEFNQNDDEYDIVVICDQEKDLVPIVKRDINKNFNTVMNKICTQFMAELKQKDADEQKVAEDKARREAAAKEMEQAQTTTG